MLCLLSSLVERCLLQRYDYAGCCAQETLWADLTMVCVLLTQAVSLRPLMMLPYRFVVENICKQTKWLLEIVNYNVENINTLLLVTCALWIL